MPQRDRVQYGLIAGDYAIRLQSPHPLCRRRRRQRDLQREVAKRGNAHRVATLPEIFQSVSSMIATFFCMAKIRFTQMIVRIISTVTTTLCLKIVNIQHNLNRDRTPHRTPRRERTHASYRLGVFDAAGRTLRYSSSVARTSRNARQAPFVRNGPHQEPREIPEYSCNGSRPGQTQIGSLSMSR